jgi:hypothetical protein
MTYFVSWIRDGKTVRVAHPIAKWTQRWRSRARRSRSNVVMYGSVTKTAHRATSVQPSFGLRDLSPLAAGDRRHGLEYSVVPDECVEECGREMEQNDCEEQKGEVEMSIP